MSAMNRRSEAAFQSAWAMQTAAGGEAGKVGEESAGTATTLADLGGHIQRRDERHGGALAAHVWFAHCTSMAQHLRYNIEYTITHLLNEFLGDRRVH
jgi:hypothetical protein